MISIEVFDLESEGFSGIKYATIARNYTEAVANYIKMIGGSCKVKAKDKGGVVLDNNTVLALGKVSMHKARDYTIIEEVEYDSINF